jgi:hypothetical protein
MEVRIGVVHTPKELTVDFEGGIEDAVKSIEKALKDGAFILWLDDAKGRRVGVPVDKLAYLEVDAEEGTKRVGFGGI